MSVSLPRVTRAVISFAAKVGMRLRATVAHDVRVRDLGLDLHFDEGEDIRTEISAKFRPDGIRTELATAGLELAGWWTDPDDDFGLSLAIR